MPDNTDYDIPFKAPALPLPPVAYEQRYVCLLYTSPSPRD